MSEWPSTKARRVLAALIRIGWSVKRDASSHKVPARTGWNDTVFAFHDGDEVGPRMLARIAKHTGLRPEDLWPRVGRGRRDTVASEFTRGVLAASVKRCCPLVVRQRGAALQNVSLLPTATVSVRRVTAALARLRSRLFVENRCSSAQR